MNRRMWLKSLCGGAAAVMWPWGREQEPGEKITTVRLQDWTPPPTPKGSVFYWNCMKDKGDWHDPDNWLGHPVGDSRIVIRGFPASWNSRLDRGVPGKADVAVFTPQATAACIVSDARSCLAIVWRRLASESTDLHVFRLVYPGEFTMGHSWMCRPDEDGWIEWQISSEGNFLPKGEDMKWLSPNRNSPSRGS